MRSMFIVLFFTLLINGCSKKTPEEKAQRECESGVYASQIVEQRMESILKSPSTAEFASIWDVNMQYLGNCRHKIISYVDSQNGFGATIRTYFKGVAVYDKKSKRWTIESFKAE